MQMLTVPIKCFWVVCKDDNDLDQEFNASQFDEADLYLYQQREFWPNKDIQLIAEIDA